jgi:hypothetical protein
MPKIKMIRKLRQQTNASTVITQCVIWEGGNWELDAPNFMAYTSYPSPPQNIRTLVLIISVKGKKYKFVTYRLFLQ